MVSVTSHKSFMVGMPVYIRITATVTSNYTMKILITVDGEAEQVNSPWVPYRDWETDRKSVV